jgi:RNA-directed DNA polymerase
MALESGVKGGKWFRLIDRVHPVRTLNAAFYQVAENKGAAGVDHVTVDGFKFRLNENLKQLSEDLPYPIGACGRSGRETADVPTGVPVVPRLRRRAHTGSIFFLTRSDRWNPETFWKFSG